MGLEAPAPQTAASVRGSPQAGSVVMVLGGVVSVQVGAAFAKGLFDEAGPAGTVFLRVGFAALVLLALWRPALRGLPRDRLRDIALFGFVLAAMNFSFYGALDRIPLGIAVTLEFVGPLAVAIGTSRRRADLVWVALAAAGIILLSPTPGGSLSLLGVGLALLAGGFWGAYILLSARIGRSMPGGGGLALAMAFGTLLLIPAGVAHGDELADPGVLAAGLGIAVLSSAIPYSLELEALRRLARSTFGVLMSIEPAVAATVGFVVLGQDLTARELVAIGLVVAASAGALRTAPPGAEA
jgi:inner membrane transporter RhtA